MTISRSALIGAMALSLVSSAAQAQQSTATEEEHRAELNREQADFARHQLEQNAANQRAYDEAVQARMAAIRRQQADYEAEKARLAREHEEAMARWRADVAACKAGQTDRCAQK